MINVTAMLCPTSVQNSRKPHRLFALSVFFLETLDFVCVYLRVPLLGRSAEAYTKASTIEVQAVTLAELLTAGDPGALLTTLAGTATSLAPNRETSTFAFPRAL